MWDFLDRFFGDGFMPHGHCYQWTPSMVWTQVTANTLIGVAYLSISLTLARLVGRAKLPMSWVYGAFGTFILACGFTHFLDVATVWHPIYWADAGVRVVTALASVGTAILVVPLVPKVVALSRLAQQEKERALSRELLVRELTEATARLRAEQEERARLAAENATLLERARSEDELRQLVDNLPDLAWHAAPDGAVDYYNQRWYEYTGTTLERMKGWGWKEVLPVDRVEEVSTKWDEARARGEPLELEFPIRGNDGGYRWFRMRVRPIRTQDGRIVRWIGTNTDIEDQRRAAAARQVLNDASAALSSSLDLEETLARVAQLAVPELADLASVYMRRADGEVVQLAASHGELTQGELLAEVHRSGRLPADSPIGYPNVIRTGKVELMEHGSAALFSDVARSEGQLAAIGRLDPRSWVGVPLTRDAQTVGALFFTSTTPGRRYTVHDVPLLEAIGERASQAIENARLYQEARAAAVAERRARDKAEEATRLKDEFLATLSHELRTPLNAVLGWGRMLQSGGLSEEQRTRGVDTIVRNAAAQNQLIDDLLDVSRIISGKLRLDVAMVDVASVVASALDVVQPAADAKGVRLQPVLDPDAGSISGDPTRLQQVVWNLLTNAVKFTPKGGRVHVTLRRGDSFVELVVADTGAGISAEFLPYAFDRFRQQDGSMTRRTGGLGLGLAIVKSVVELHGGTVDVESAGEGRGATFTIRIPIAPVRSVPVAGASRPPMSGAPAIEVTCPPVLRGLKVLVLDDDRDARDLVRMVLEHCEAIVTTVATVPEALSAVASGRPDVIVSDIGMPEEDGYSFIKKLRQRSREEGGRTPAVALTAYARQDDRTRALIAGFQSHATKPVDPQEILVVVANLAGRYT